MFSCWVNYSFKSNQSSRYVYVNTKYKSLYHFLQVFVVLYCCSTEMPSGHMVDVVLDSLMEPGVAVGFWTWSSLTEFLLMRSEEFSLPSKEKNCS